MALNPETKYPGRITASDANYDYGSSKDETAPGAGDGTPYEKARANDVFGFQQALLKSSGIVPSGNADTQLASQYLQSLIELVMGRAINYDDSGVADAYVLDVQTDQQAPASLFDGMIAEFIAGNTNTGASTVNLTGLGVKNIVGTSAAGTITVGDRVKIRYRSGSGDFELITIPIVETKLQVIKSADESVTSSVTLQDDDELVLSLEANSVYQFYSVVKYTSASSTPDFKYLWNEADGIFLFFGTQVRSDTTSAATVSAASGVGDQIPISAGVIHASIFSGIIETGGAGGDFKFQWAQNVSDATATVVKENSYMRAIKLS